MRIEIDLPDWCDERHIYVLAGIEMVAYKLYGEDAIHIKKERCNECGKCCEAISTKRFLFERNANGDCIYLQKSEKRDHGVCSLGMLRPHVCGVSLDSKEIMPYCNIEYEVKKL